MRSLWLVILALLTLSAPLLAQEAPPAFDVQPPRLGQGCQSMKPVAGADFAVYESPLCAFSFEVIGSADVIWWLDDVEVARGGTYTYIPTNSTDYLIFTHVIKATGTRAIDSNSPPEWFAGPVVKVEVVNPPVSVSIPQQQNICSWLDENLAGTCSKVLDNLVGLVITGILGAIGAVILF